MRNLRKNEAAKIDLALALSRVMACKGQHFIFFPPPSSTPKLGHDRYRYTAGEFYAFFVSFASPNRILNVRPFRVPRSWVPHTINLGRQSPYSAYDVIVFMHHELFSSSRSRL